MKTYYPIHTLLVFFICTVTFASTSKDFLAVGKRTRTFATAPAVATHSGATKTSAARGVVSTKGGNSGGEIITTKGKLVLVENGADVGVKFINTTQELTTVVVSTMPTLTRVTSSGITVTKNVDKTVTILGKYNDDISYLLDDLEYPKTLDFEAKKNGYNLLNAPDELYLTAEQFWLQFNKPFLDKAILRGDDIVLATNPTDAALNVFDDAGSIVGRSGFGREYDHLLANGYVFDDVSKKMVNAGSDLFSSFLNLRNLPIEVKTFLSNKNWDDPLLTELDGDLVNTTLKNAIAADETLIDAWEIISDLPSVLRTDIEILEGTQSLLAHNLFQNIGSATKGEISNIHRYTINSDYLNIPMRGPFTDDPLYLPNVTLDSKEYQSYLAIKSGLQKLRSTSRLETGIVFRGRALSQYDYNRLFGIGSPQDIPIKGFISASKNRAIAEEFAKSIFPGVKYRMIWKIKSKDGVYVDDISDWGQTLGPINHGNQPDIMIQQEVLMEEGLFRKVGQPQPIMEGGELKVDTDAAGNEIFWMEIELEEIGTSLRQINQ